MLLTLNLIIHPVAIVVAFSFDTADADADATVTTAITSKVVSCSIFVRFVRQVGAREHVLLSSSVLILLCGLIVHATSFGGLWLCL